MVKLPHIQNPVGANGVVLSLLAHGLLLAALAHVYLSHALAPPLLSVVNVDLVPPPPAKASAAVAQQPAASQTEPIARSVDAPGEGDAESVGAQDAPPVEADRPSPQRATQFYAAGILNDPRNRELQRNFGLLGSGEQLIQLCNIEALEQLGQTLGEPKPNTVVGYAFGDMDIAGNHLGAPGGAFRQGQQWYHVNYDCTAAPDLSAVTDFAFTPGAIVPENEWEEHFLNADDDGLEPAF
ncbi:DUF930 domain-containing protein [Devosia aquimaris]|uniref:DUF930 domain-containing protein n=1 Tax=Devosia aquimaris TaxID=2866214 RepID=UPI001CD1599A|nr:DUF930 domain-containing protein [Devosia sp. CJK-A8-3]